MTESCTSIGEAAGDCLKAVFELQAAEGRATTSALAARLRVAEPTVTAMVKRLARQGLLNHAPYRGVELTAAGERVALEVIRHHRLLELYLAEVLGLSWEKVHAEADRLEHLISDDVEDRLDDALGHPTVDPHGHPIPTKSGEIDPIPHQTLVDLDPAQAAVVRSVPDRNPELLQYLARLGLVPGARVVVLEKAPFGGPLTLAVADGHHAVSRELASTVRVSRSSSPGDPGES